MYNRIPSREFPEDNIKYSICCEPLTEVKDFVYEPYYYNLKLKGSQNKCFMRKGVYEKLKLAESYLPEGYRFKIYDAWRPFEVQLALYNDYREKLCEENPKLSSDELDCLVKQFVSLPLMDEFAGPVHATGGAVDLTVIDKYGNEIDMGTYFDYFRDMANTDYFERHNLNDEIRNNRRMLYGAMTKAGFTNLPTEWWHYDYGNKFYAYYTGEAAIYKCSFNQKTEE